MNKIPAVYMRGGTSRALIFHARDLPVADSSDNYSAWRPIFLAAIGSPDPNGRQLNGIGGGVSSLSKVAVVGPPTRPDADLDYTFGQVRVGEPVVEYNGNCGNILSAIGPFAIDEGLITAASGRTEIRIHNTNTGKVIASEFSVRDGRAVVDGDFEISGVAGGGAPIKLTFFDPGGAATGRLLPTGNPRDLLDVGDGWQIDASMVDVANPVCFVLARDLRVELSGVAGSSDTLARLAEIRLAAAVSMGLASSVEQARGTLKSMPLVCVVGESGRAEADIAVQMMSSDQPHKASPLTGALCLAAAAAIPGTLVHQAARAVASGGEFRIAHPTGILSVASNVVTTSEGVRVSSASAFRTARRIMDGHIYV